MSSLQVSLELDYTVLSVLGRPFPHMQTELSERLLA